LENESDRMVIEAHIRLGAQDLEVSDAVEL
jgi:hypothetical protein